MWVSDHQPKTQPTATARKIATLLRIDHSIIREITAEISPGYGVSDLRELYSGADALLSCLAWRRGRRWRTNSCGAPAPTVPAAVPMNCLRQPAGGFLNPPGM